MPQLLHPRRLWAELKSSRSSKRTAALAGLPGHDFSPLLWAPEQAHLSAIREAVLFNYVGLWTVDPLYMIRTSRDLGEQRPVPPFSEVRPDMTPRGFISFVYDGRYKFARYYAPDNFATPTSFEALTASCDLELFDLERDPDEMHSLAAEPAAQKDLILRQNDLLNRMIAREVGDNNGSFLPAPLRPG
jgi:arylsulfatase